MLVQMVVNIASEKAFGWERIRHSVEHMPAFIAKQADHILWRWRGDHRRLESAVRPPKRRD